ncbi:transposase [Streptomyces canus]|uniref:transposase n=1 Tax=Streptomyces canus TaxID=58343 RepID=UPI0038707429
MPAAVRPEERATTELRVGVTWVVERSFAWLLRSRRLVRDYERRTDTSEAVILWSMTMLMSHRLAAQRQQRPAPARAA